MVHYVVLSKHERVTFRSWLPFSWIITSFVYFGKLSDGVFAAMDKVLIIIINTLLPTATCCFVIALADDERIRLICIFCKSINYWEYLHDWEYIVNWISITILVDLFPQNAIINFVFHGYQNLTQFSVISFIHKIGKYCVYLYKSKIIIAMIVLILFFVTFLHLLGDGCGNSKSNRLIGDWLSFVANVVSSSCLTLYNGQSLIYSLCTRSIINMFSINRHHFQQSHTNTLFNVTQFLF